MISTKDKGGDKRLEVIHLQKIRLCLHSIDVFILKSGYGRLNNNKKE